MTIWMEHQSQTTPTDDTTSVIRLTITDKLFKDVDRSLSFPQVDTKPPLTLLAVDSPTSVNELNDSLDELPQMADTTKATGSDTPPSECPPSVLVDTKALNRQKELDERYGGWVQRHTLSLHVQFSTRKEKTTGTVQMACLSRAKRGCLGSKSLNVGNRIWLHANAATFETIAHKLMWNYEYYVHLLS